MGLRALSEAIILQSAEDLLSTAHRKEGLEFFCGEGFSISAEMAGMVCDEKLNLLNILLGCIYSGKRKCSRLKTVCHTGASSRSQHSHKGRKSVSAGAL